jgi:hypothetical protein
MIERTMKAIVTKYAITAGPKLMEGSVCEAGFTTPGELQPGAFQSYYHGRDWHADKRSATDDVLDRFARKYAGLKKQIAALQEKRDKALKAIEGMEL